MTFSQVVFANFRVIWKTCSGGILTCRSSTVYHFFFFKMRKLPIQQLFVEYSCVPGMFEDQ